MPSYSPGHGEFKNLCFIFVTQRVRVSHAFVYYVVGVNKIINFGKTTFLHERTINFRVATIAYLLTNRLWTFEANCLPDSTETLNTHSLNTVDSAEKEEKKSVDVLTM